MIVLHVLSSAYNASVSAITRNENKEFYFQIGISEERYNEVWSSLSISTERRQTVESGETHLFNKSREGNTVHHSYGE